MPPSKIAPVQTVVLLHRESAFGRATLTTTTYDYLGQEYHVRRPMDGAPPRPWVGECIGCSKPPRYRVYSVAATNRVRTRWKTVGAALLIVGVLATVCFFVASDHLGPGGRVGTVFGGLGGVVLGLVVLGLADSYFGFRGRGSLWPDHSKHRLIRPGDPDFKSRR
jgi:hypothetical protein